MAFTQYLLNWEIRKLKFNLKYNYLKNEKLKYKAYVLYVKLLYPLGEKSPIKGFLEKNANGGIHHICIEV